jgi:hypothetical protein
MDDLQLVAELARDTRLLDADELTPARDRLVAAIREERAGDEPPARPMRRHRRARRFVLAGWATAGVAAAVAAAVLVAVTGVPDRAGDPIPVADTQAVQVLQNAAAAALKLPDVEPRANQFIYQKTQTGTETWETWYSVDGTRDGLGQGTGGAQKNLFPGCRDGRRAMIKGDQIIGTEPCTPQPAYLPDLPTDADAMLAYLNKHHSGNPGDVNAMGKDVLDLAERHYLRPPARAALFGAAARIPRLRMVPEATDGAGRPGVGVAWSFEGGMAPGSRPGDRDTRLIFDARTYAFLGITQGRSSTAMMAVAIVDEVGQRP